MRWIAGALAMAVVTGAAVLPARAETLRLDISGMAFSVPRGPVHVGDTVIWSNHDFVDHTVTARDGSFDVMVPAGKTGRITLAHPGSVPFYCRYHPNMTGVFNVLP